MSCPSCGSTEVIEIQITLHSDEHVSFHSCHACEYRWWRQAGSCDLLTLGDILARAAVPKGANAGRRSAARDTVARSA